MWLRRLSSEFCCKPLRPDGRGYRNEGNDDDGDVVQDFPSHDPVAPSVDPAKEFGGLGQHCEPALLRWHAHNLCDDRFGLLLLIICNDAMFIVEV